MDGRKATQPPGWLFVAFGSKKWYGIFTMKSDQIRDSFLKFFERHGHIRRPSSSLLPDNDPSVLLTTAGMQQFKPYFLGERDPEADFGGTKATTAQKCFRTSDIDQVGDASHLTFFEMMGNFSFGDYSKVGAIDLAWEYMTKVLHLPKERLWVTIFAGDEHTPRDSEAEAAWLKYVPPERIFPAPREDNFWGPPGKTGPCGPCSEIYVQLVDTPRGDVNRSADFLEVWNLVFMELLKDEAGHYGPLPKKNVDTGMGLERMALVLQQKQSPYETDVYASIIAAAQKIAAFGPDEDAEITGRRLRIIADHIRGATFLLADGVDFSNKDQGYILRRIVRRAADQLLVSEFSFDPLIDCVVDQFSPWYPELEAQRQMVKEKMNAELEQYRKVLSLDVAAVVKKMRKESATELPDDSGPSHTLLTPDEAFTLYSTHGVSLERLGRLGFAFERTAVEERITQHQELSRSGVEKKFGGHGLTAENIDASSIPAADKEKITRLHSATHLLHAALRKILGPEVKQMGSDINPERLRFDFSFHRKLTDEEKLAVEMLVNEKVAADLPVTATVMPFQQAIDGGALAFFKEKYPDQVKVYAMGDFSKELCGGPHVTHTAEVGKFKITAEQSVGSGVRRVKGVVG